MRPPPSRDAGERPDTEGGEGISQDAAAVDDEGLDAGVETDHTNGDDPAP